MMPHRYASMEDRLIANSALSLERFYNGTACWEWTGAVTVNRSGFKYPKIVTRYKRGPRKGKPKSEGAHRVSLRVFRGQYVPRRVVAMHLCNYTLCINPMHLDGGTQKRNVRQCVKQGRHRNQYSK